MTARPRHTFGVACSRITFLICCIAIPSAFGLFLLEDTSTAVENAGVLSSGRKAKYTAMTTDVLHCYTIAIPFARKSTETF